MGGAKQGRAKRVQRRDNTSACCAMDRNAQHSTAGERMLCGLTCGLMSHLSPGVPSVEMKLHLATRLLDHTDIVALAVSTTKVQPRTDIRVTDIRVSALLPRLGIPDRG